MEYDTYLYLEICQEWSETLWVDPETSVYKGLREFVSYGSAHVKSLNKVDQFK
jgi:hypothetical protein